MLVEPIGRVRNTAEAKVDLDDLISEIEVFPEFAEGLYRIEESRELLILFAFDRSSSYQMHVHPHGDLRNPEVGVFASRSPNRPNFIGVTQVELLRRAGNLLTVKGLDALNGTPVIDIKPVVGHDLADTSHK
jgi:tRNA-Thr(GGU) m(6)t(6)A37 methyltransferase TsaA